MNRPNIDEPQKITQGDFFPVPVFQIALPEMAPFQSEITKLFNDMRLRGELGPHTNGYGYQTKTNLFDPNVFPQPYFRQVLLAAFQRACQQILSGTVTDFSPDLNHQWINTFNTGWAVLQTNETWSTEIPWHTHLPAVLSGCYYVNTSEASDEGNIQFGNPIMPNIFQPKVGEIEPMQGNLLIFPSFLNHRPTATPNIGNQQRLVLCMDGHWTSRIGQFENQSTGVSEYKFEN